MGLFGKKEICPVCGNPVSGLFKIELQDGTVCSTCRGKCSPHAKLYKKTSADVIAHLQQKKEGNQEYKSFTATDSVGKLLLINRNTGRWCAPGAYALYPKAIPDMFDLTQIVNFSLDEDGESVGKGGLGSAVVGGVLLGGAGAIIGAGLGRKQKAMVNKLSVVITLRNEYIPAIEIPLISSPTKKNSGTYRIQIDLAKQMMNLLSSITADLAPAAAPASAADELAKYKGLLDSGAITQEEYDKVKSKILGL